MQRKYKLAGIGSFVVTLLLLLTIVLPAFDKRFLIISDIEQKPRELHSLSDSVSDIGSINNSLYPPDKYYLKDGMYYPINDTIVPKSITISGRQYQYGVTEGWYSAYFRSQSSDTNDRPIAMVQDGYTLTMSPSDSLTFSPHKSTQEGLVGNRVQSTASIWENKIFYHGFYTEMGSSNALAHLTVSYLYDQLKEDLMIINKNYMQDRFNSQCNQEDADIVNLTYTTVIRAYDTSDSNDKTLGIVYGNKHIKFKDYGSFADGEFTTNETVYFTDSNGAFVYYIPELYAYDYSKDVSISLLIENPHVLKLDKTVRMTRNGNLEITVLVPYSWLNASTTEYPITIDPPVYGTITQSDISSFEWEDTAQGNLYGKHCAIRVNETDYYLIASVDADNDGWLQTIRMWNSNGSIQQSVVSGPWEIAPYNFNSPTLAHIPDTDKYMVAFGNATVGYTQLVTFQVYANNGTIKQTIIDTQNMLYRGEFHNVVQFSGNVWLCAYTDYGGATYHGFVESLWINSSGTINNTRLDFLEFDTSYGMYPTICIIDSDTFGITHVYGSSTGDFYLRTINITSSGDIASSVTDSYSFEASPYAYSFMNKIGTGYYGILQVDTSDIIKYRTLTITDNGMITKSWTDTLTIIDATQIEYLCPAFVVRDPITETNGVLGIAVYGIGSSEADGYMYTWNVSSTGTLDSTITSSYEFDTSGCLSMTEVIYSGANDYYLVVYAGPDNHGWAKTIEIATEETGHYVTNTLPSPVDGATGILTSLSNLHIRVNDSTGANMNVTFWTNASGSWLKADENLSVANGTYYCLNMTWLTAYNHHYWWEVRTNSSGAWDNDTYDFWTNTAPTVTTVYPSNHSVVIDATPICYLTVADANADDFSVYWYENTTDSWVLRQTNATVYNGTYRWNYTQATGHTTYWWKYAVNDGYTNVSAILHFDVSNITVTLLAHDENITGTGFVTGAYGLNRVGSAYYNNDNMSYVDENHHYSYKSGYYIWYNESNSTGGDEQLYTGGVTDSHTAGSVTITPNGTLWFVYGGYFHNIASDLWMASPPYTHTDWTQKKSDFTTASGGCGPMIIATENDSLLYVYRNGANDDATTGMQYQRYQMPSVTTANRDFELTDGMTWESTALSSQYTWGRYDPRFGYQFVSMTWHQTTPNYSGSAPFIYSDDNGTTWRRSNGTAYSTFPIEYNSDVDIPYDNIANNYYAYEAGMSLGVTPNGNFYMAIANSTSAFQGASSWLNMFVNDGDGWVGQNLSENLTYQEAITSGTTLNYTIVAWAEFNENHTIKVRVSSDDGVTWSEPIDIYTFACPSTTGPITDVEYVQPMEYEDNKVRLFYTYAQTSAFTDYVEQNLGWLEFEITEEEDAFTSEIDTISPYFQDQVNHVDLTATVTGEPDNVTLWYRWSPDNTSWGTNSSWWDWHNDTVDTNSVNKGSISDVGTENDFANAQDLKDSDVMTLVEGSNGTAGANYKDISDSNTANKQDPTDVGVESNYAYSQDTSPDADVMTLAEYNNGVSAVDTNLSVNGFTGTVSNWDTHAGTTPYLNTEEGATPTNYILETTTDLDDDYWYTFTDTTETTGTFVVTLFVDFDAGDGGDDCAWHIDTNGDNTPEYSGTVANTNAFLNPTTAVMSKNLTSLAGIDTVAEINAVRIWFEDDSQGGVGDMKIDYACIRIQRFATTDYECDFEYQFNSCNYSETNEEVCFYLTGSLVETLFVDYWTGSGWTNIGEIDAIGWHNFTATNLQNATYNIRIYDENKTNEATNHSWTIDCLFLHVWSSGTTNYGLNFQYQWTTTNFSSQTEYVNIYVTAHTGGTEDMLVKYWDGDSFESLGTISAIGWNNFTATLLQNTTYTIQLKGATETGDSTQDTWTIDSIHLETYNTTGNPNVIGCDWTEWGTDEASPWAFTFDVPNETGYYEFYSIATDESPPANADAICHVNYSATDLDWYTSQILTGTFLNSTQWRTTQTISGTILNILFWQTTQTLSGTIQHTVAWQTKQTITGIILNTSAWRTKQTLNGSIFDSMEWTTVQTISGTIQNLTQWRTRQTVIGTVQNTSTWRTKQTINGTIIGFNPMVKNLDTDEEFLNLTLAIDDSDTVDGHTLLIYEGFWNITDTVTIDKELTIQGYSATNTTLNGSVTPMFNIADGINNVTIQNLNLSMNATDSYIIFGDWGFYNDNFTIINNIFYSYSLETRGVSFDRLSNSTITNNSFSHFRMSIQLSLFSSYNTISNNTILSHNEDYAIGIVVDGHNESVFNNTITSIAKTVYNIGFLVEKITDSIIYNNNISGFNYGIKADIIDSIDNITFYNNYVFNNTVNANVTGDGSGIYWNITKQSGTNIIGGEWLGGNYWDDYTGADTTGDGLGDTDIPYNCSGEIISGGDYHPLCEVGIALEWHTIQTVAGSILNLTAWGTTQTITGEIKNITGFRTTQTISGNVIVNETHWYTIQTITGLINNILAWQTEQTIQGLILNVSGFKTVQTISGEIKNTILWRTEQTLSGTILNITAWRTKQTISGQIANISAWRTIKTINGIIQNISESKWHTIQTVSGSVINITSWKTRQTISGSITNIISWKTEQTIIGLIQNVSGFRTVQTLTGSVTNVLFWNTLQTITGEVKNLTSWRTTKTISGTITSSNAWHTIQTISGNLINQSNFKTVQIISNNAILNVSAWHTVKTVSGQISNLTAWRTTQTINGVIQHTSGFKTVQTVLGAVSNATIWHTIQTVTGSFTAYQHWQTVKTINGAFLNISGFKTIQTISGGILNITKWTTKQIISGQINNISGWHTIQILSGQIQNIANFQTIQTLSGSITNVSAWRTKQTINGTIQHVLFWHTVKTLSGVLISYNLWRTVKTISGTLIATHTALPNGSAWETIQALNNNALFGGIYWHTEQITIGGTLNNWSAPGFMLLNWATPNNSIIPVNMIILKVNITHTAGRLMNLTYFWNDNGTWYEIAYLPMVGNGTHSVYPYCMNITGETYTWRIKMNVSGYENITQDYSFTAGTLMPPIGGGGMGLDGELDCLMFLAIVSAVGILWFRRRKK